MVISRTGFCGISVATCGYKVWEAWKWNGMEISAKVDRVPAVISGIEEQSWYGSGLRSSSKGYGREVGMMFTEWKHPGNDVRGKGESSVCLALAIISTHCLSGWLNSKSREEAQPLNPASLLFLPLQCHCTKGVKNCAWPVKSGQIRSQSSLAKFTRGFLLHTTVCCIRRLSCEVQKPKARVTVEGEHYGSFPIRSSSDRTPEDHERTCMTLSQPVTNRLCRKKILQSSLIAANHTKFLLCRAVVSSHHHHRTLGQEWLRS